MNLDALERTFYFKENWSEPEKNRRTKKTLIFGLLFLIFCLIFFFIYFLISSGKIFKKEKEVELKIETPEEIFIGENFNFKISIFNQENSDLVNSELTFNFPEDFYYLSSNPPSSEIFPRGCVIGLPRIRRGEKEEIEIEGKIFALPEEIKNFTASFNFQLENFSSRFKKEITKELALSPAQFDLEIQGSKELMPDEEGEFRIRIKNKSEKAGKTRIIVSSPDDFNFTFLSLEAKDEEKKKFFDLNFEPNEEKNIDFKGFFSEKGVDKTLIVQLGVLDPNEKLFLQSEKEWLIKNTEPGLVLGIKINNLFLDEISQNFDEKIGVSISYKNTGQEKIFNPTFKLKINPSFPIDFDELKSEMWHLVQGEKNLEENNWQIETNNEEKIIVFNSQKISEIEPGEDGEINFSLKIKSYEEIAKLKPQNLKINFIGEVEAKIFRRETLIFKTTSNEINLKINSKVKLEVEVRYFSDEGFKIGDGPLPPKVNETTSYVVFLRPINTINEIRNIKITTNLSEKVNWLDEEKVSVGKISFDNFSKEITWQIDSLPAYSGGAYSFVEASFRISLTPSEEDRNQILTLLEKSILEADDVFTGSKIYSETKSLDANLEFDDWAKGRGRIE